MKKLLVVIIAGVLLLSCNGCGKAELVLAQTAHTFPAAGETLQLSVESDDTLIWTSSDPSVVTVDEQGLVTAVCPGEATVTVSDGQQESTCSFICDWVEAPDLSEFAADLKARYPFGPSLTLASIEDEMGATVLENYYPGLIDLEPVQNQIYYNAISISGEEFSVVEMGFPEAAATVEKMFHDRIKYMVDGGAWYPAPTRLWNECSRVVTEGNCVLLVVHEQCDAIVADFLSQF